MIQDYILIAFTSLSLYLTSMWGEFLFDDTTGFSRDPNIMSGNIRKAFGSWRVWAGWRRLLHVSYAATTRYLNAKIPYPGKDFFFFHLGNVLLHAVNGCIVLVFLRALEFSAGAALFGALLFTAHPLAVNAVANISGRSSVLSGVFYGLALLAAIHHPWLAVLLIPFALFSKEDTIVLPIALSLLMWNRGQGDWWILLALPPIIAALSWRHMQHVQQRNGMQEIIDVGFPAPLQGWDYRLTAFAETILLYPQWLIGRHLNIDHDVRNVNSFRLWMAGVWLLVVLIIGTAISSLPQLGFFLAIVSPLIVYWFVVLPDPISEHRAYVSLFGVSILAASLYRSAPYLMIPFLGWLAYKTLVRQHAWSHGVLLWNRAYRDGSNKKARVLANLNWAYQRDGHIAEARHWAEEALKVAPKLFPARHNLAFLALKENDIPKAKAIIEAAMQDTPNVHFGWTTLCALAEQSGDWLTAELHARQAVRCMPKNSELHNRLGTIFFRRDAYCDALAEFLIAHKYDPENLPIMYNIGMCQFKLDDKEEAKVWLDKMGPNPQVPAELKELLACCTGFS